MKNFDMEQKIELEIRLRELAAQSLREAKTEIDVLEVEKSLLTSDQRMNCYASQLEQQRKQLSNPSLSTDSGRGSKTGLAAASSLAGSSISTSNNNNPPANNTVDYTGTSATSTTSSRVNRPDVVGGIEPASTASSPANSQSPSKLSPVSGESATTGDSMAPSIASNRSRRAGLRLSNSNTLARHRSRNRKREQLLQSITSLSNINCNMLAERRASVTLSELRIPLMWKEVDHFKNKGDYKRFAAFCLVKHNSQIYDTQLIADVDRQMTDLNFDDVVVFNELEQDFELTLEVYSCVYMEQFSLSSTPRKLKEKFTSSVSRAMGRRLTTQTASTNYTKQLEAYDKSYRFTMIASANLRLSDAADSVKTYDLNLVSPSVQSRHLPQGYLAGGANQSIGNRGSSGLGQQAGKDLQRNSLPLFGHFCCKIHVQPDLADKVVKSGYLRVATIEIPQSNSIRTSNSMTTRDENDSKLRAALAASTKMASMSVSSSKLHWGLLRNFTLHLWPVDERQIEDALAHGHAPQLELPKRPLFSIGVNKFSRLLRVSNSSLTLESSNACFILAAYCPPALKLNHNGSYLDNFTNELDEIGHWLRAIEQVIYDSHIWGSVLKHNQQNRDGRHQQGSLARCVSSSTSSSGTRSRQNCAPELTSII